MDESRVDEHADGPETATGRGVSRRALMTGGAVAVGAAAIGLGAGVAVGRRDDSAGASDADGDAVRDDVVLGDADVIVVGGGIAGLTAARQVVAAGRTAVVLEARDHVGGRMVRQSIGGGNYVDLGGQWVGPTQDHIIALADELGVERFPSFHTGRTTLIFDGRHSTFAGDFVPFVGEPPDVSPAELADAQQAWARLEALTVDVPADGPWTAPNAAAMDAQTLASWIDSVTTTSFGRYVLSSQARIGGSGAFEPNQTSLLHTLWANKVAPQREEPEEELFVGAAGQIPELVAAELGDRVVTGAPVRAIAQDGGGVTVRTDAGTFTGRYVVVAMPPHLTAQISYDPPLPAQRIGLTQRTPMGTLIRQQVVYPTPFWRDRELNGVGIGDLATIEFTADASPQDSSVGVLTSFIAGDRAVELGDVTPEERKAAVLADYVTYFGPEAAEPTQYIERNWAHEPWTGGAFTSYLPTGAWIPYGPALRVPVGRIHWAGTEVATRWVGYFDGAVRSGEDAAAAILDQL